MIYLCRLQKDTLFIKAEKKVGLKKDNPPSINRIIKKFV